MFKSIRFKLILWFFIILSIILATFSFFLYFTYGYSLYSKIDASLQSRAEGVSAFIDIQKPELILHFNFSGNSIDQIGINFPSSASLIPFIDQSRVYGQFIQIADMNGDIIEKSSNLGSSAFYLTGEDLKKARKGIIFAKTVYPDEKVSLRILTYPVKGRNDKVIYIIQVGTLLSELENSLEKLSLGLFITVPATLLLALLGGFVMAGRVLKPIEEINKTAKKINAENLERRLEIKHPDDEIGKLQKTLNNMFDRLERAFLIQRRFTADASHELRTPLTILKGEMEVALKKERNTEEYREVLKSGLEEVDRLTKIVTDLLFLARADEGKANLNIQETDAGEIYRKIEKQLKLLASEKNTRIDVDMEKETKLKADPEKIKQLLFNLMENSIKYNKDGGKTELTLKNINGYLEIKIKDNGIGISEEDLPHIFDRFYRVDKARSREIGGSGLGLSIVKWIVEAHRGKIEVESKKDVGTTFTVRLPVN